MRGERPLFAGVALGALWLTRRCSGLKRLLICAAVLGPWLFALPLARAHDTDYDAYRPARSHHRRVEDHHRDVKDAWNEHIVAPFEDFANDVAELFTPNEETPERGEIINPTPVEERCPWITEGVVGAARANPLTKALVERTRMSHPFGPGARDEAFKVVSEENKDKKFGWENAVVLAATVKIDRAAADTWLPKPALNISDVDEAILFVAWYPDSFCCGAYHEAALLLKVVVDGRRALHCPWMLVDSDVALIAGREILGFPKKMGEFEFEVTPPGGPSAASNGPTDTAGTAPEPAEEVSGKDFDPDASLSPGARITARVSRNGAEILAISGVVSTRATPGSTIMPRSRNVVLNAQTSHPLPAPTADAAADAACLGNRPRILRFAFDEVPSSIPGVAAVVDAEVDVGSTRTDPLGVPFGVAFDGGGGEQVSDDDANGSDAVGPVEVVDAVVGVTSFFTGEEPTPRLFETIPRGWLEDDDVYWLRYQ